jgi:hypothetical protein
MDSAKEVFGWADKLSDRIHAAARRREISAAIHEAKTTCGSCDKWMIPACPREVHSNRTGRSSGPSCKSIKCDHFVMKRYEEKRIEALTAELEKLKDQS